MDASDYQKIRQLFDDYLRMYASRDDLLTAHFSEDFSGITGSGDFLVKDRAEWVAITRQDFAQIKDPIRIELKDLAIQLLADTIAVATSSFTIRLPIEDHVLSRKTARLVLIFRKESAGWKISHSSISIPFGMAREGEVYPLQELEGRNQFLEELIDERTIQLSEANANLQQTNAELAREISEHKRAEEALLESEAHYRLLTEDSSDVVWKLDSDYRFTYISPADERLRGYRADEVLGHHVFEIFDEEGIASLKEITRQRQEAEQHGTMTGTNTFEAQHRCKDGRWLWAEINATPLRDADGTITGYHGITREITDRKRSQEQIYQLAFYDALTTLPNRRLLLDLFRQALVQAKRFQRSLAIMYLDIDNFKRVNDSLGHDIGDELLKIVAVRLQACVRNMDTVCRQGGDEFIVVLSEITHPRDAAVVADKIIKAINKPVSLQGHDLCITISIGIAIYPVNGTDDARELMKKADIAMYEVKNKDKNGYALYQSPCY
jgi:diguanylate cyclase (GGDEF)-like protein/PAS domain S-box-containing protein